MPKVEYEEVAAQFKDLMTQKVKKDIADRKLNKKEFIRFPDFFCGVILTNTNDYQTAS